jgi:hypothetical protein
MIQPVGAGFEYPELFLFSVDAFWDLPLKWALYYSSCPIYTTIEGKDVWSSSKGQLILQTQIYFNEHLKDKNEPTGHSYNFRFDSEP